MSWEMIAALANLIIAILAILSYIRTRKEKIILEIKIGKFESIIKEFILSGKVNSTDINEELMTKDIKKLFENENIKISVIDFLSDHYIKGIVEGLLEKELKKYKIVVYVLTNKWYIHPEAVNTEGFGYANIRIDGTWKIKTKWRTFQAYKVAFCLVKKSFIPPATVEGDSDYELIQRINPISYTINIAPEGI
ncbi:MAG: hypothetical protein EPN82_13095 [Bacteroidetes bacterium]|nr:MAG: hypothetical protein EPN82_13095 [Bacteroidota bacterium]